MAEASPDWVLSKDVKDAIVEFAVLTWETQELEKKQKLFAEQVEWYDDVLSEFDLESSWLSCGEAFVLIESTEEAIEVVTERQNQLSKERDAAAQKVAELDKVATQRRNLVESQLGDKVRLRMD